jgi:TatA/E family protein of Tat protein translocase
VFSVPDILVVSVLALLLFGPDRLPKMMRQAGRFMREVQNTSHSFVAEMERAADLPEPPAPAHAPPRESAAHEATPPGLPEPPPVTGRPTDTTSG